MKQITKLSIALFALLLTVGSFAQERTSNMLRSGWTIDNYEKNVESEYSKLEANYTALVERTENDYKPTEKRKELKRRTIFNEHHWVRNEELIAQQIEYERKVRANKRNYNNNRGRIETLHNEWKAYANAVIQKNERIENEKNERAERERLLRIQDSIRKVKAEEERQQAIAEWDAMPTNPKYIEWKAKYERALSRAQANMERCEAIINRNMYRNAFGQNMYDPSRFSQADKKSFQTNIQAMAERHDEIGELERERYVRYWNENQSMQKSTQSYRLSSYLNEKRWTFAD